MSRVEQPPLPSKAGILLDSSVLIEAERGRAILDSLVGQYGDRETFVSVITISELRHGVHRARTTAIRARRAAFVQNILDQIEALPIDESVAEAHAAAWAALEDSGRMIGMNDLWIAATAIAHGCGVVTQNATDFRRVPGLVVLTTS